MAGIGDYVPIGVCGIRCPVRPVLPGRFLQKRAESVTLKPVLVSWVDAHDEPTGWVDPRAHPVMEFVCQTVGFLKDKDDNRVVLFATVGKFGDDDELGNGAMTIPTGCVRSIVPLEVRE